MHRRTLVPLFLALVAAAACDGPASRLVAPQPSGEARTSGVSDAQLLFDALVVRERGAPSVERFSITLGEADTDEVFVRVTNGPDGGLRVAAAEVRVGGAVAFARSMFSATWPGATTSVAVTPDGSGEIELAVELFGGPGGTLRVEVFAGAPVTSDGGSFTFDGGEVGVEVPSGAVVTQTVITAEPTIVGGTPSKPEAPAESGALTVYDFGPDGSTFAEPLTISLPFDVQLVPAGGRVGLFSRNSPADPWTPLDNVVVDAAGGRVSGQITHFTEIGVLVAEVLVCPGTADATQTITEALAAVVTGGRILLCDGDHAAPAVPITRSVTVTSAGPGRGRVLTRDIALNAAFVLTTAEEFTLESVDYFGGTMLATQRFQSGMPTIPGDVRLVTVRDVNAERVATAIDAQQLSRSDAVIQVDGLRVTGGSVGLFQIGASRVVIRNSVFRDLGFVGVQLQSSLPAAGLPLQTLEVYDSEFSGGGNGVVALRSGAGATDISVRVEGNRFERCRVTCINAADVSGAVVRNNVVRGNVASPTQFGIAVRAITGELSGNVVDGIGTIADRSVPTAYPFTVAGIRVMSRGGLPFTATLTGNRITGASYGLVIDNRIAGSTLVATDHTIERTLAPLLGGNLFGGGVPLALSVTRSDFLDYVAPLAAQPQTGAELFPAGSLTCNWWGAVSGPVGAPISAEPVSTAAFTPFATEPIAGRAAVSCGN